MIALKNGRIVTPDRVIEDKVLCIKDDKIEAIRDSVPIGAEVVDAGGQYIMPGFIDIHSDKIEQLIQPRPTSQMDFELSLKECERELLNLGITTMYHSLSLYQNDFFGQSPIRTKESVLKMAKLIAEVHTKNHLIRHRLHLRIEIDFLEAFDIAKTLIEQGMVHEISFMDHTPGQGQYRNLEIYEKAISNYSGAEFKTGGINGVMTYHQEKETLTFSQLQELTEFAHAHHVAVASHDDDTVEKLQLNNDLGVDISEFPITIDVAKAAHDMGLLTVIGAPNILLGGSHSGNMSAADAISAGCGDILCSDYYPPAILHSIFVMHKTHGTPLCDMVNRCALNPAKAMKIDDAFGSLEAGKKADVLIVDLLDGYPVITHVFVDGRPTSAVAYRK
ncbi:MAG: alpha-D-ribose 1-methylphosphonate 5-triphosphate diphosphatase [Oscillospiraceae bacterium]